MVRGVARCGNDGFELGLFCGQGIKVCVFFGVGGVDLLQARLRGLDFPHAAFYGLAHCFIWVHLRLLRQVANFQARHGNGFAFDFGIDAGHDFEQG